MQRRGSIILAGIAAVVAVLLVGTFAISAVNADDSARFRARLVGFKEVPAVSTGARGRIDTHISQDETTISYTLTFSGLEAPTTAAHIHFGQRGVNGGISAFMCGGSTKPACPASGTVSGTIMAADVIGPAGQGIDPGEFAELLRALRAGVTYANVHSTKFPSGEIRGQLVGKHGNDHDEDSED